MKKHKSTARSGGFTLIELLIVIAIMGVLAGIVLVSVNNARQKASNVRVLAEVSQMKSALEQGYTASGYTDLAGSADNIDTLAVGGPNLLDLTTLLCGIGSQGGYPGTVTGDITLTCDGTPGTHTGVIIYSNSVDPIVMDFGVYATTTPGGYVCADSYGHTLASATSSIPAYASLASPTTALCQ